jgi:hypothetical protein
MKIYRLATLPLNPAPFLLCRAVLFVARLLLLVKRAELKKWTVPKMFSETAKATPDKVMFYFEDQVWTFKQVLQCYVVMGFA